MIVKYMLKIIRKILPDIWLKKLKYIHSSLLRRWILSHGSEKLEFNHKPIMVFSPHQDDETFGCGGMIALKREFDIPVVVVFLTDGGLGFVDLEAENQRSIIQTRQQEAITALKVLGVEESSIYFLNKPDGNLQTLRIEERENIIKEICQLLEIYQPGEVYVPHYRDCHQDHEATYQFVQEAIKQTRIKVELFQYPIWLFWEAPLFAKLKFRDIAKAVRFSITPVRDKKHQAISSYSSQLEILPLDFVKLFMSPYEIFFAADNVDMDV